MQESQDLVERIERLERENRRWKRIGSGALLATLVWLSSGLRALPSAGLAAERHQTLEAERFVLLDANGEETAVLGLDSARNPSLHLKQGKAHAFLTLSGPSLLLRAEDGRRSAFLGFDNDDTALLNLTGEVGSDGMQLSVERDGSSRVSVKGPRGRERAGLGYSAKDGTSNMTASDENGRVRAALGLEDGELPSMAFMDENGVRRIAMFADPDDDGLPFIGVQDHKGRGRIELTTSFDGSPILALRNADGKASFQAP